MNQPATYRIPPALFARIGLSWISQQRRDFRVDALACLAGLALAPQVSGCENIPTSGACLVTFNHYNRPGFNVMWLVMALAAALPAGMMSRASAVMTAEFTYPGKWYGLLGRPLSRLLLKRLARVYGFMGMPPMPPRAGDVAERARSVRSVLAWLEQFREPVLLLAPEGSDQPGGILSRPPAGVGRFMALMAARGLSILPAAGWEQDGGLYLRFGPPYRLSLPDGLARDELDLAASAVVMRAIAALLPESLRGEFRE
jgi:1-acyl-sn-glycerol-3-phosphate acyltransferase